MFLNTFHRGHILLKLKIKKLLRKIKSKNLTVGFFFKIITELFQHKLINVIYLTACYLYQVMMTLHVLNDVANEA